MEAPKLLSDLRVQVKDVELRHIEGIKGSVSIKSAWKAMKELKMKTLPVTRDTKLEGLITIGELQLLIWMCMTAQFSQEREPSIGISHLRSTARLLWETRIAMC